MSLTSHAVINANKLLVPQKAQGARRDGDALQRCAHSRTLGEAYTADVLDTHAGLPHRLLDKPHHPCAVVFGGILGQKALTRRSYICVTQVRKYLRGAGAAVD